MLKLAKLVLDKVMLCLPEGGYYRREKYDELRVDLDGDGNLIENDQLKADEDPESAQDEEDGISGELDGIEKKKESGTG